MKHLVVILLLLSFVIACEPASKRNSNYAVGFKDVYPWVWSVLLGLALVLAERRSAYSGLGTRNLGQFVVKNGLAVLITLVIPAVIFGFTMTRLGPLYSPNMNVWQILGALYLAAVPLGAQQAWLVLAVRCRWVGPVFQDQNKKVRKYSPAGPAFYAAVSFVLPLLWLIFGKRCPW